LFLSEYITRFTMPEGSVASGLAQCIAHSLRRACAGPSAKKQKKDPNALPVIIQPSQFATDVRAASHERFVTSTPYTHVVLRDLCDETLLRQVRDEIINNIDATYKETDLFKVFQTGAHAQLAAAPALVPC
jgi:hypothetical protein